MTVTGIWFGAACMGWSFAEVETGLSRDERRGAVLRAHFGIGGGSERPVCTANGASASERSDRVTCSSDLSILTALVGRLGCRTSTMVSAPPQPGSRQSRSLTLTTVSSSALRSVRACAFNSSATLLRRFGVFLGKINGIMRTPNLKPDADLRHLYMNVITLHSGDQSASLGLVP